MNWTREQIELEVRRALDRRCPSLTVLERENAVVHLVDALAPPVAPVTEFYSTKDLARAYRRYRSNLRIRKSITKAMKSAGSKSSK